MENLELLVHISAPTSHKDDEHYRRLAEAADDFEATTKITCTVLDGDQSVEIIAPYEEEDGVNQQDGRSNLDCRQSKTAKSQNAAICGTATQSNQIGPGLESLQQNTPSANVKGKTPIRYEAAPDFGSFTSTSTTPIQHLDEIKWRWSKQQTSSKKRPAFRLSQKSLEEASTKDGTQEFMEDTQQALAALVDHLPSSVLVQHASVSGNHDESRSHKRRRLSVDDAATLDFGKPEASVQQSPTVPPAEESAVDHSRIPEQPEDHGSNSQLRDSYGLSNSHSQSSSKSQGLWPEIVMGPSTSFELPLHGSQQSQAHTDENEDASQPHDDTRNSCHWPRDISAQLDGLHEEQASETAAAKKEHTTGDFNFASLPIELEPPPPITAYRGVFDESTQTLKSFGQSLSLDRYFNPLFNIRHLKDDERGCWIIETNSWTLKHQYEFWTEMGKLITTGRLGAVRCQRNAPQNYPWVGTDGKENEGLGTIWVFCWGQVVAQLWLTMLVHSHREIEKSHARWTIGSPEDLEVVVQMT
ncbi:hypothetical protein BKA80DRAFT_266143 [Phyllosticta citrichinensis]